MKGQTKRFVSQKGELFDMGKGKNKEEVEEKVVKVRENVGFFDLWRYATPLERIVTVFGVLSAWLCSGGLAAAVLAYGEVTSLLVLRHNGEAAQGRAQLLSVFGGGQYVQSPNRTDHMEALVQDSMSFGLASLAIMCCQLCAAAVAVVLTDWAAGRMVARLRVRLLRSALRQEMAFYDTNSTMNFVAMLTEDMERIRAGAGQHVAMCSYLCGSVACASALAAAYGWQLTLVGLALVPFSVIVAAVVAKYQTRFSSREAAAYGTAGRIVEETLASLRTVRAYGGEEDEVKRYVTALVPASRWARARGLAAGAGAGGGWLLTYALNAAVFAYGTQLCVRDLPLPPEEREYHPGVMVTVLFCTFMAAQNIAMCHPHLEVFSAARGAASAIYRLLERTSKIDSLSEEGEKPEKFEGDIKFENVYFNYPSRPDVKVLRGFSLHIKPGETVALVGGSGCGKSTTLQLLQRLYDSGDGAVLLDGRDVRGLNLHHYRSRIGVVGQEPVLFGGTIRENITIGLDDVSEEDLIAAAKTANAHQFISKLAMGYDTYLGSGGAQLSGGQKQRIAIARAMLRKPAILLLDEPTSALDPASEKQVQAALDAASVGRTTVVVSHRLSTVVNASRIVYMEQGAALEQGTYSELVEKKGLFWTLLQADMTTKSMEIADTVIEEEEANVPEETEDPVDSFQREFKRRDTYRESLSPERRIRGSRRLCSISAAHVPNAASTDLLNHAEAEEDEDDAIPPASTCSLLKLNAPEKHLLIIGGIASFCIGATMPAFALLFSKLYGMFTWSDPELILSQSRIYAGLFLAVAALCGLVTFLQAWLLHRAGARLTDRLREITFRSYLKQEQAWFDNPNNSVGALCARLATDCAAVQGATGSRLGAMMQGVSTMIIGVTLAMVYSWKMTLVSLISVPCVMGGIYLESLVSRKSAAASRKSLETASRVAAEAVMHLRTVQSLGVESRLVSRFAASLPETPVQARLTRGAVYGLCLCAPTLGYAVSLAYGGYLVAREGMPLEYTILVSEALIYGAWMLAEALSFAPNFAAARRAGARVIQIMTRTPMIQDDDDVLDAAWTSSGEIEFKSVNFAYPSRPNTKVLRGLSLKVPSGATAALVGPSGCGKSTIMQLLLRLYEPESGSVLLDGVDIRRLPLATLRSQLGLVQQEPALFSRAIRENIAYGNASQAGTDEIIDAATKANVHNFIAGLPAGYETHLGSGGAQLSGGQKQRIAIARALLRDPKILLLDEATSALDATSEKSVQTALEAASQGRTTVIIAHRLATVRHAHTIVVIDRGVVAEMGSHDELLRKRGLYYELWQQQASS